MLKIALTAALLAVSSLALAGPPPYTGKSQQGWVIINGNALSGHMNVRFNPRLGDEASWIHCGHTVNSSVTCSAFDANTSQNFSCSVANTSPWYDQAVDIVNNLGDGSYLFVSRAGNVCATMYMAKASTFQH